MSKKKEEKKEKRKTEMVKVTEILRHNFTQEELNDISSEMARGVQSVNAAENEKKAVMSDYKSRIDALSATVKLLAGQINSGYEMRPTPCTIEKDFEKGEVRTIRNDTGDLVKTRPMTDADREANLPGVDGPPDACEDQTCINHDFSVNRCKIGASPDTISCKDARKTKPAYETPEEDKPVEPGAGCNNDKCRHHDKDNACCIHGHLEGFDDCKKAKKKGGKKALTDPS